MTRLYAYLYIEYMSIWLGPSVQLTFLFTQEEWQQLIWWHVNCPLGQSHSYNETVIFRHLNLQLCNRHVSCFKVEGKTWAYFGKNTFFHCFHYKISTLCDFLVFPKKWGGISPQYSVRSIVWDCQNLLKTIKWYILFSGFCITLMAWLDWNAFSPFDTDLCLSSNKQTFSPSLHIMPFSKPRVKYSIIFYVNSNKMTN